MDIQFLLNPGPLIQPPSELRNSDVIHPLQLNSGRLNSTPTPKPGREARSISDRSALTFGKPRHRIQRSYSREFKITVLKWWLHHRTGGVTAKPYTVVLPSLAIYGHVI